MSARLRGSSLQRPAVACALAVMAACPATLDATEPPAEVHAPATVTPAPEVEPAPAPAAAPPRTSTAEPAEQPARPPAPAPTSAPSATPVRAAASASVSMQDFSFSPATVSVNTGDSVTWTNGGQAPHTATGQGFDTGSLGPGESGSATFRSAGTFPYVCSIHPNMRGTVRVAGAAAQEDDSGAPAAEEGDGGTAQAGTTTGQTGATAGTATGQAALPASGLDVEPFGLLGLALLSLGLHLRWRTAEI